MKRVGDVMTRRVITVHEGLPPRTWPGSSGWAALEGRHFPPERSASLDPAQQVARSRGEGSDDIPGGHGGPRGCPRDGGAHHARERCEASPRDGRPRRSGGDRQSLRLLIPLRPDDEIRDAIERAITEPRPSTEEGRIRVLVEEGLAKLDGCVAGKSEIPWIVSIPRKVDGVADVESRLEFDVDDVGRVEPRPSPWAHSGG